MCGIAGYIGLKTSNINGDNLICKMIDSMVHRGPDNANYSLLSYDNNLKITFGHCRLTIIDLTSHANQPMSNKTNTITLIFNGEVYNYLELKEELILKGYDFFSSSDTEVVLKSYEEWGVDCFKKFNGMWAIAIFDKNRNKVILSRDRFGVKPLFYYKNENEFIFASEIKAILRHSSVKKVPNYEKIYRYIARGYRYVDIDEKTFFENISQIPKSCYFEIDQHLHIKKNKYWYLDPKNAEENITDDVAIAKFREIFFDSVRIRLRSDVPLGCMLSGGLDSTSIACTAYKILDKAVSTFSGITGEKKGIFDESEHIDSVIRHINANFYYIRPEPQNIFDVILEMLSYHDEPICTDTWYTLFLITKQIAKRNIRVVLNGHAGDEILAGYWPCYHYNFYDLFENGEIERLFYEIEKWKENHKKCPEEIKKTIRYISEIKRNRALEVNRFKDYSYLLLDCMVKKYDREIIFSAIYKGNLLNRLYTELFYDSTPTVLRPEDRNTMSQSIESRSPFLDFRLVEFCFSLPNRFKIRDGIGKWILRESMKGILPEDVRNRKDKTGFVAPADEWFRTINKNHIFDLINSESFRKRDIFNIKNVKAMFREHLEGKVNHQMILWQIINLELWFRIFFDI